MTFLYGAKDMAIMTFSFATHKGSTVPPIGMYNILILNKSTFDIISIGDFCCYHSQK